jgi:hypothetical protein
MADNNRNWGNQSNRNWDQNRYDQDENRNSDDNYFDANYYGSAGAYNTSYGSNYGASYGNRRASVNNERSQDWSGGHRGKGPKGYHRSEERIREDAYERLTYDDTVDATNIEVQVQGDDLILTGTVNSREEKRRAENIVESISGVRNVENRIRVGRSDEFSRSSTTSRTMDITAGTTSSMTDTTSSPITGTSTGAIGSASDTNDSTGTTGSETTRGRRGRNK